MISQLEFQNKKLKIEIIQCENSQLCNKLSKNDGKSVESVKSEIEENDEILMDIPKFSIETDSTNLNVSRNSFSGLVICFQGSINLHQSSEGIRPYSQQQFFNMVSIT